MRETERVGKRALTESGGPLKPSPPSHIQSFPNHSTNWGPSIQTDEPMGGRGHSHSNYHTEAGSSFSLYSKVGSRQCLILLVEVQPHNLTLLWHAIWHKWKGVIESLGTGQQIYPKMGLLAFDGLATFDRKKQFSKCVLSIVVFWLCPLMESIVSYHNF